MPSPLPFALFFSIGISTLAMGQDVASLLKQGDALDRQLKTQEALAVFRQADQLEPNNAEILYRIAKQYGLSMTDASSDKDKKAVGVKALETAKLAVAADPKNANARLSLAVSYGRLAPFLDNKTKIAYSKLVKEEAEAALQLNPNDDVVYHVLGAWNYELANLNGLLRAVAQLIYGKLPAASNEEAVRLFLKAIELAPNKVANHIELGRTYVAMGKGDLAKAALNKGLSLPNREKDDEETKERGRKALKKL